MKEGDLILRSIEAASKHTFLPIVGKDKGSLLENVVRARKPKFALEIGTLVGYSGILIARNLPKESKLITIEFDRNNAAMAAQNFKKANVSDRIKIIFGDARKIIPKLDSKFDFVFIDAEKKQYFSYIKLLEKHGLLSPDAVVLADNVKIFAGEMKKYLDYVRESGKYRNKHYDFGWDGMELSRAV